jgi:2-methylcitrate dehydratase PrpD
MTGGLEASDHAAAERIAERLGAVRPDRLPADVQETARRLFLDIAGLCVAARHQPYISAILDATDRGGACTAIGHRGEFDAFGAALLNGTAAHGEDYDDTFEGGPVHAGAVIVSAVLAICEREALGGDRLLAGIVSGAELMCRLSLVAPTATHRAGFHPTAVFGSLAAACGVGTALGLTQNAIVSSLGIAGSMASGLIEYLADGSWTKRMHAGWAAQSGVRAALMARGGFVGPRTVLEGRNGVYRAFAPGFDPDFGRLFDRLGTDWIMRTIAFKPYACGTMAQPYVDCAIELANEGVRAADVAEIVCEVAEGTVHRLWEPIAAKRRPPTPYAAKFSTPFCIAVGLCERSAGLAQFTESRIHDPAMLDLMSKISYEINPRDEYPRNFSGHLRATLTDGTVREVRQAALRGGARAPLPAAELERKFRENAAHGGWRGATADRLAQLSNGLFTLRRLDALKELRI